MRPTTTIALALLACCTAGQVLGASNVPAPSVTSLTASSAASAIAPATFYKAAQKDRAPIAPFTSVATWLKEGSVVLLDLRSPREFDEGHLPGAVSLPATELTYAALSQVIAKKSSRVVIYCSNNLNLATRRVALTTLAYPALKQLGYTNVLELESAAPGQLPFPLQASVGAANAPSLANPPNLPNAPNDPNLANLPKALLDQIERLTQLLRDRQAQGYAAATMVQNINLGPDRVGTLAIFTVEGFEGGNSHTQYLALFAIDSSDKSQAYYTLLDVMPIAGRGWRGIDKLHARTTLAAKGGDIAIAIDALEVGPQGLPNFPSKKTVIHLTVHADRMHERK